MDAKTEILLKEYELRRTEHRARADHTVQALGFILAGSTVGLGLTVKDGHSIYLYILFPWISAFIMALAGSHFSTIVLDISYLKELEERLKVLDYERCVAQHFWREQPINPVSAITLFVIYPLIVIADVFTLVRVAQWASERFHGVYVFLMIAGPILFTGLAIAFSIWGQKYAAYENFPLKRKIERKNKYF